MLDYNGVNWEDYFYYDESSPSGLRWKINLYAGKHYKTLVAIANDVAGCLTRYKNGKAKCWNVGFNFKRHKVHRIIYKMHHQYIDPSLVIDHIDRNPANNKIDNLRLIPKSENQRNLSKHSKNTSGISGVRWHLMNRGRNLYAAVELKCMNKRYRKLFADDKYEDAFAEAVKWKEEKIRELNAKGAGFTENHGK